MRYRILLPLAVLAAIGLVLVLKGSEIAARSYMNEAEAQAGTTLRLAVSALDGHLKRYEALPALIADQNNIEALIFDPRNEGLRARTNAYLKEINALLTSSDIYVMTLDGATIAASNYDSPVSFVGENFIYRPYFQDAVGGRQSRFYALGTTSLKRGYYFGSPIEIDGIIRGVIVFKVDIDSIEASWGGGDDRIFVSDPEGIIFMTGSPEWLYASILPLTPDRIARTEASRRYADTKLRELPVKRGSFAGRDVMMIADGRAEKEYLVVSQLMPEAGWTVNVLMDTGSVRVQAQTVTVAAFLTLCLAGLALAIIVQRRARLNERMQLQAEARNELERRVAERTADLARVNSRIEEEIAERRLTEQRLRQTQADLIQAGKLAGLGQMSAALSHELNQPLAAAKTYTETTGVLIDLGRIEEARDNVSRISALIDRMASISKHLRNFARKPNEKLGAVTLDEAMRDTLEIVAARLKAADATLEIKIDPALPAVKAGAVRLQQVLVNIITNAADAVEGLDDRRITVSAGRDGDKVTVSVRDRGPGVAAAIRERIFDPFFTTKGVGKGLGLGLSISYNIVKDFGGSLSVADHPEGGAVFLIELQVADGNLLEAAE
ncbi:two-component system C4-dicarboxylate transport sensor histidine kinase DctB [Rhizobium petrolearium]|uniref:sensor histidine kinase n=1 Tax=Neorhizobium petrolearium TaxID=515361 RepID=UPI001FDE23D8|nr:sensor histidine kinase [Neorhizobium petrolearium]MBP1842656.1 two-component system C4-dicarboxylate transport sensor histidine kinase DctB [Neorhizobium petrolearium]